jgi:hypothetical protein
MTTTQNEFANEVAIILKQQKIEDDIFITKYTPIIKEGLLKALKDGEESYTFYEHFHCDDNPRYFKTWREYKEYYKPMRNRDRLNKIAEILGIKWPDYNKTVEIIKDDSASDLYDSDDDDCDVDEDNYKNVIGWQFFYPKYDASVVEDVCAICLEEFKLGQTVNQCSKCNDCIHLTCNRQKIQGQMQCAYCRERSYYCAKDNHIMKIIPRMKPSVN